MRPGIYSLQIIIGTNEPRTHPTLHGLFGRGIEPDNLVPENVYRDTFYLDPLTGARHKAYYPRNERNCDLIIRQPLHRYKYKSSKIDDRKHAARSTNIDEILGGHTHFCETTGNCRKC